MRKRLTRHYLGLFSHYPTLQSTDLRATRFAFLQTSPVIFCQSFKLFGLQFCHQENEGHTLPQTNTLYKIQMNYYLLKGVIKCYTSVLCHCFMPLRLEFSEKVLRVVSYLIRKFWTCIRIKGKIQTYVSLNVYISLNLQCE